VFLCLFDGWENFQQGDVVQIEFTDQGYKSSLHGQYRFTAEQIKEIYKFDDTTRWQRLSDEEILIYKVGGQ
jgi:hypothetical protein